MTGSGKTTIGGLLAHRLETRFADADDYHPAANKAKLAAGTPLTDEDRRPWLETLNGVLMGWEREDGRGVMACSALKDAYRETLVRGLPEGAAAFVLLEGSRELIEARLAGRHGHFMNPALLDSQIATLEDPGGGAFHVCNDGTPEDAVQRVLQQFRLTAPGT